MGHVNIEDTFLKVNSLHCVQKNNDFQIGKIKFETKGDILLRVKNKLELFQVPDLLVFTLKETKIFGISKIIDTISNYFSCNRLVIRSSALCEDSLKDSKAGKYTSILDIDKSNKNEIMSAIKKVFSSYDCINENDQIIVQECISNVSLSGVIFTRDINTGAPYFVINYDDVTGLTDSVTAGKNIYSNRILYIRHNARNEIKSARFSKIYNSVIELIKILGNDAIDIEFGLSKDLVPFLFQVRPITTKDIWKDNIDIDIENKILSFRKHLKDKYFNCKNNLNGFNTFAFSQMTDWNPAEIIGTIPRRLSFSLYKNLITDKIWSTARTDLGYSQPDDIELVKNFCGYPYVNVRASFESFIPNKLDKKIKIKLVKHYMRQFKEKPDLHDKVEFGIIPTTYTLDINNKLEKLVGKTLNQFELEEYKNSLKNITIEMLVGKSSIQNYLKIIKKIEKFKVNTNIDSFEELQDHISYCKAGTFAFAALARHGFVAKSILDSIQSCNIMNDQRLMEFYSSFETVASEFVADDYLLANGKLNKKDFTKKYGHLRPGTYDILSPRYDQMDISVFKKTQRSIKKKPKENFLVSSFEKIRIKEILYKIQICQITPQELLDYCSSAIKAREYSKFVFSRLVSAIIESIASLCEQSSLSRDDISHLELETIIRFLYNYKTQNSKQLKNIKDTIDKNRKAYETSLSIRLPAVLTSPSDLNVIPFQISMPNFITQKKVVGSIFKLNLKKINKEQSDCLTNKIILIEGADPGYDWLFLHSISGLITRFGGVNSHMAIRCAEFGIPAAIGCGDHHYYNLSNANAANLDCMEKKLSIIS